MKEAWDKQERNQEVHLIISEKKCDFELLLMISYYNLEMTCHMPQSMIDQNDPFYKIKLNLLLPLVSSIKFVFQAVKTKN